MNRNNVFDFVERLRSKPEHVRRRIAVGTTAGVTGIVAAGWLLALVFSGSLNINPANSATPTLATAPGTTQIANAAGQTQSAFSQLLGAVGFANNANTAPASLTIVGAATGTPSTSDATDGADQSETGGNQTVIPF